MEVSNALFDVHVIRTPFGALGLQPLSPGADGRTPFLHDSKRKRTESSLSTPSSPVDTGERAYVGLRGLLHMSTRKRAGNTDTPPTPDALTSATISTGGGAAAVDSSLPSSIPETCLSHGNAPQLVSRHTRGTLLFHNVSTGHIEGVLTHDASPRTRVAQVVATASYIFTRLEEDDSPTSPGAGTGDRVMEYDTNIYVWPVACGVDAIKPAVHILRHHSARVTAITAHPSRLTVLASTDEQGEVCLWDLAVSTTAPVYTATLSTGCTLSFLTWSKDVLVGALGRHAGGARTTAPLAVWRLVTASAEHSQLTAVAVQPPRASVVSSSSDGPVTVCWVEEAADASTTDALPSIYTGNTAGYVQYWTPASKTSGPYTISLNAEAHKTPVEALAVHTDPKGGSPIVVTGAASNGIAFLHVASGKRVTPHVPQDASALAVAVRQGISSLVVDGASNSVLVGTTGGYLLQYDYAAMTQAEGAAPASDAVHAVWCMRPHLSAITGCCLAVTPDGAWDSVTTACADGSFTLLTTHPQGVPVKEGAFTKKEPFSFPAADGLMSLSVVNLFNGIGNLAFPGDDATSQPAVEVDSVVGDCGVDRAFARAGSSDVDLVEISEPHSDTLTLSHRITFDGAIVSAAEKAAELARGPSRWPRLPRQVSYTLRPTSPPPSCVCITHDAESHMLSTLFDTGLLQIIDLSSMFVCARHWLSGAVMNVVAQSDGVVVRYMNGSQSRIPYHRSVPAFQ